MANVWLSLANRALALGDETQAARLAIYPCLRLNVKVFINPTQIDAG